MTLIHSFFFSSRRRHTRLTCDWSSDVCSSDLLRPFLGAQTRLAIRRSRTEDLSVVRAQRDSLAALVAAEATLSEENRQMREIGRASCRERVEISVVAELWNEKLLCGRHRFNIQ